MNGQAPITGGARGSELERLLGPTNDQIVPNPFDNVAHTHYDLPELFKGQVKMIREALDAAVIYDTVSPLTTVCCPWLQTPEHHFQWQTWEFNVVMAGQVPHEGVSRLVTTKKTSNSGHVLRRGLAFMLEADFFGTPTGRRQFQQNVRGIQACVQETVEYDVVCTILTCKTYQQMWQEKYGNPLVNYHRIVDDEKENYCCLQRDANRLEIMVEHYKRIMKKMKRNPDVLLWGPGLSIYISMCVPARTTYWEFGPDGVQNLKEGPDAITNYRGLAVYEMKDFIQGDNQPPVQLLTQAHQVGERYTMFWRHRNQNLDQLPSGYETRMRDIWIYNQNTDDVVKIEFSNALSHAGIFDASTGEYSSKLVEFVKACSEKKNYSKYADTAGDPTLKNTRSNDRVRSPFPLATCAKSRDLGSLKLLSIFGEMDSNHMTVQDLEQVAQTVLPLNVMSDTVKQGLEGLTQMIVESESAAPLTQEWINAVIAANPDLGTPSVKGLRIPEAQHFGQGVTSDDLRRRYAFPPGFLNFQGLAALAEKHRDTTSAWQSPGFKAGKGVEALTTLASRLRSVFPDSLIWKSSSSLEDSDAARLFDLFYLNRPTIAIKKNGGSEKSTPTDFVISKSSFDLDGLLLSQGESNTSLESFMEMARRGVLMTRENQFKVANVQVPGDLLQHSSIFLLLSAMGKNSFGQAREILKACETPTSANDLAKYLISVHNSNAAVNKMSDFSQLRQVVRGLYKMASEKGGSKRFAKNLEATISKMKEEGGLVAIHEAGASSAAGDGAKWIDPMLSPMQPQWFATAANVDENALAASVNKFVSLQSEFNQLVNGGEAHASLDDLQAAVQKAARSNDPAVKNKASQLSSVMSQLKIGSSSSSSSSSSISSPPSGWIRTSMTATPEILKNLMENPLSNVGIIDAQDNIRAGISLSNTQWGSSHLASWESIALSKTDNGVKRNVFDHISPAANLSGELGSYRGRSAMTVDEDEAFTISSTSKRSRLDALSYDPSTDGGSIVGDFAGDMLNYWFGLTDQFSNNSPASTARRLAAKVFLLTPCNRAEHWNNLMTNNVHVPLNILLWRLFIEHNVSGAIMMVGGPATGAAVFGNSNFVDGSDVVSKMIYGNYTFNSKAVIWEPRNVCLIPAIRSEQYNGGMNTQFIDPENDQDRAVWENLHRNRHSIIATVVPLTEPELPELMSFTGFLPNPNADQQLNSPQHSYSTWKYYTFLYNEIHANSAGNHREGDTYLSRASRVNVVAFQGLQFDYNPSSRHYDIVTECRGHRGRDGNGRGAAAIWDGQDKFFKKQEWSQYVLA